MLYAAVILLLLLLTQSYEWGFPGLPVHLTAAICGPVCFSWMALTDRQRAPWAMKKNQGETGGRTKVTMIVTYSPFPHKGTRPWGKLRLSRCPSFAAVAPALSVPFLLNSTVHSIL
jgi:hypothetical protein